MTREGAGAEEREPTLEALLALLEDRRIADRLLAGGQYVHLLICNGSRRHPVGEGNELCNCPLGVRIKGQIRAASAAATAKERARIEQIIKSEYANPERRQEYVAFGPRALVMFVNDVLIAIRGDEQEGAPSAQTDAPKKE